MRRHERRLAGSGLSSDLTTSPVASPSARRAPTSSVCWGDEDSSSTPLVWPSCGRAGTSTSEVMASATPGGSFRKRVPCSSEWTRRTGSPRTPMRICCRASGGCVSGRCPARAPGLPGRRGRDARRRLPTRGRLGRLEGGRRRLRAPWTDRRAGHVRREARDGRPVGARHRHRGRLGRGPIRDPRAHGAPPRHPVSRPNRSSRVRARLLAFALPFATVSCDDARSRCPVPISCCAPH